MTDDFTPHPQDLEVLTQVLRHVARVHRLSAADAEDLAQSVRLRLVQRNYDIFRRFKRGRSLSAYLSVVVARMLIDRRNAEWGKWRPSSAARRLGPPAVLLERLIQRDGLTREEAIQTAARESCAPTISELRQLVQTLPARLPRRELLHQDMRRHDAVAFLDPIEAAEHASSEQRMAAHLGSALRVLARDERRLLYLRFVRNQSVSDIARGLCMDPKRLYRRFDASLHRLRVELAARGITSMAS